MTCLQLAWQELQIPPLPKAKAGKAEEGTEGALTSDDYDLMLHGTIALWRRVDGAQPDFDDGEDAVNWFAPPGEMRCIFCIFFIFCRFGLLALFCQQTLLALVAACLWVLVLFYGLSWYWCFTSENPSQIASQKHGWYFFSSETTYFFHKPAGILAH
jgi:hypothetical protein